MELVVTEHSPWCLAPLRGVGQGRGRSEFEPKEKILGCERCLIFVVHFPAFLTGNTLNQFGNG